MSRYYERIGADIVSVAVIAIMAKDLIGRVVSFGAYVPNGSEREINRGDAFGALLSNTFGNAR